MILKGLRTIKEKNINAKLKFNISKGNNEIIDFLKGEKFGDIEIDFNQIKHGSFTLNGINLIEDENFSIRLSSLPTKKGTVDIVFKDGFELNNVSYATFQSSKKVEIVSTICSAKLIVSHVFKHSNDLINFNIEHPQKLNNVSAGYTIYGFLKRLKDGLPYSIFANGEKVFGSDIPHPVPVPSEIEVLFTYFEMLKQIELENGIRFSKIERPTKKIYEDVYTYAKFSQGKKHRLAIKGEVIVTEWDNSYDINALRNIKDEITVVEGTFQTLEIHGHVFPLGYRNIVIPNPEIINIAEIEQGRSSYLAIQSKTEEVIVFYTEIM